MHRERFDGMGGQPADKYGETGDDRYNIFHKAARRLRPLVQTD